MLDFCCWLVCCIDFCVGCCLGVAGCLAVLVLVWDLLGCL